MLQLQLRPRRALALVLAALIALPQAGLAQAPAKLTPVAISQQKVELLFVQNSTGIEYDKAKGTLKMKNIGRSTLFFTDRPVRMAGHYHTRDEFLKLWSEGPDSFAKNPPNATLSMLEVGQADLQNAVINLKNPRMQGRDLIYDITIIEGTVPQAAGDAVLFIDILGVLAPEHPTRGGNRDRRSGDDGGGRDLERRGVGRRSGAGRPAAPGDRECPGHREAGRAGAAIGNDAEARAAEVAAERRPDHAGPVSEGLAAGPQPVGAMNASGFQSREPSRVRERRGRVDATP